MSEQNNLEKLAREATTHLNAFWNIVSENGWNIRQDLRARMENPFYAIAENMEAKDVHAKIGRIRIAVEETMADLHHVAKNRRASIPQSSFESDSELLKIGQANEQVSGFLMNLNAIERSPHLRSGKRGGETAVRTRA